MSLPKFLKFGSEYIYEWTLEKSSENEENIVKDANGNDAVIEILEEFKKQDDKIYHPVHILYFEFTQNSKHSLFSY